MTDPDPTPRRGPTATGPVSSGSAAPRARRAVAAVVGAVAAGALVVGAAVPVGSVPSSADPVAEARRAVEAATADRERAEARLADITTRRVDLEQRTARLAEDDTASTVQLADARRRVRELAVAAYIDGGRTELLQATLDPEEASAVAWRVGMVSGGADQVSDAVAHFEDLRSANDPEQQAVAAELDQVRAAEAEARSDVVQTSALERDAGSALDAAVARRKQAALVASTARASATAEGTPAGRRSKGPSTSSAAGLGTPVAGGGATAEEAAFLAKVRQCESGGNYSIVSSTGRYRGAYQFSVETWRGVGGTGDPAAASPAEQDARALALLRLQGKRAWPVCSRR